MAAELPRPGVEIIQEFKSAAPTVVRPTLVPFVCGAAKEIVEVTTSDGLLNPHAKQGSYAQLPRVIGQSSFPSPRGNIAEVNVEEATVKVFFQFGGSLKELPRDPGEGFLVAQNLAKRPVVRSAAFTAGSGLGLNGKILILALNVTARLNTTKDVAVTFSGTGNLTPAQIVAQINDAVGEAVASEVIDTAKSRIQISSLKWGAGASVTIRPGGSANPVFAFADNSVEYRIEGSGFRAQDQNNNTTLSPWVEWSKGSYQEDGVEDAVTHGIPAYSLDGAVAGFGWVDADGVFTSSYVASSTTFTGSGSLDLKVGDEFFADGVTPNSALIMKVEATRFKLGTINTKLSVFDVHGNVVSAVYDQSNVNTLYSSVPFSPRYAWFRANGLVVNTTALPAILTGTTEGKAAETATVTAPGAATYPLSLAGLTIEADVTVDGVALATQTFTFTGGPFANVGEVVTAVSTHITGCFAETDPTPSTKFALSTTKTGATQALTIKATSTALAALGFSASTTYSASGKDVEFVDIAATLVGSSTIDLVNITTKVLNMEVCTNGNDSVPSYTTKTHTFGAGPFANAAAVLSDILADATFVAAITPSLTSANHLKLTSVATGSAVRLRVKSGSNTAVVPLNLPVVGTEDFGENQLTGLTLNLIFNDRPKTYSVLFTSNSLVDAVAAINEAVGWPVASIGGTASDQLVLTSTLKGYASKVQVFAGSGSSITEVLPWAGATTSKAVAALGFGAGNYVASGSGRPNPDLSIDVSGNVVLGAEILRSAVTGAPFDPGTSDIYIQYTALRLDVSPMASHPALLRINNVTDLGAVLSPIRSDNPLALGMFFQLINAPGIESTGMGVDEASAAEPFGTPLAFTRVANFIESEEIYAIAPLTHSETVAQIFKTHAEFMSGPAQKGERIVFMNALVPSRAVDDVVASGLSGNTTATSNQFVMDVNSVPGLVQRGIDPGLITVADQCFLALTVATSSGAEIRNYCVSSVNGTLVVLKTNFASGENDDSFFSVTPLTETLVNADWNLSIRGNKLLIPGSTLVDKNLLAETVQKKAAAYKQRRLYYVFPDKCKATIGGTEELLDGFYMCAAIVGMVARFPPQQGFTNLPVTGFTGVVGSNDFFSVQQLDVMAAGGVFIMMQEAKGAPIISRHQLSTNLTSIETRELSITKVVDFTAKFLRTGLRNFIGTFNITQPFLDTLSTVIQGMLSFLTENGVIIGGDLNNLIQSKDAPDTVLVDVTLNVPYPCNYIRLTLVI